MLFPSPSTWKIVKDAPNNVMMNMIGLSHTSHEILDDVNVPIFSVAISNPDPLQLGLRHHCDRTGIPLSTLCVEFNTICIGL